MSKSTKNFDNFSWFILKYNVNLNMEIRLTKGLSVLVDAEDYEFLNRWKWYALKPTGNKNHYAARGTYDKVTKKRSVQYMHRVINPTDVQVDHKNHNTLDNRRSNLRSATMSQNKQNSTPTGVSKYLGVSWSKAANKWQSHIYYGGKKKYLGTFSDEWDAAEMYNVWAKIAYGEYANLNKKL